MAVVDVLPMEQTRYADLVLPEATYLERYDPPAMVTTHKRPFVAIRQPAIQPFYESKPGWWIAKADGATARPGRLLSRGLIPTIICGDLIEPLEHRRDGAEGPRRGVLRRQALHRRPRRERWPVVSDPERQDRVAVVRSAGPAARRSAQVRAGGRSASGLSALHLRPRTSTFLFAHGKQCMAR